LQARKKGEVILEQGPVNLKKGLFSNKRQLIVTDKPRIIFVDPDKLISKLDIPFTDKLTIEISKNNKTFQINTPKEHYSIEDLNNNAIRWSEVINRLKSQLKKS